MRVLWVTNFIPPMIAEKLGLPSIQKEGWVSGMLTKIVEDEENGIKLAIASPVPTDLSEGLLID